MNIVEATLADLQAWISLALKLWPEATSADLHSGFSDILASPREIGFLVKDDRGTAIGFMNLSLRSDYVPGATRSPIAYVEGIYLEEPYRKQGIGTQLIHYAEQWAREHDCHQLASDALLDNTVSYEFHTKLGFQEVERIVAFIKPIDSSR